MERPKLLQKIILEFRPVLRGHHQNRFPQRQLHRAHSLRQHGRIGCRHGPVPGKGGEIDIKRGHGEQCIGHA
ncbi:hypothetical protein ATN84_16505 [Paramesorhizobium deserti]|uniref:Uncharacterized protein n=1 Tax=Paramesorhizobium deserti TaxID=1494590 RepID=A0A135HQW3_9HYPH|nr:hypothetical protein ATN84_16505 [Paramesorhizobium deserti]